MTDRLVVVPCWGGRPGDYWYPWLKRELAKRNPPPFEPVIVGDMPSPDLPTIAAWVNRLEEIVGGDPADIERTVLLGHSVGCQAVVRYLAALPDGIRVAGTLLVAAWLEVDEVWETIRPWVETPIDSGRIPSATDKLVVMLSDNDPFTADYSANGLRWEKEYGATVHVESGAFHFNEASEPAVLERLLADLAS